MKQLLQLILIISLTSCSPNRTSEIENNPTFNKIFTITEIADLDHLYNFFNASICSDNDRLNSEECYANFLEQLRNSADAKNGDYDLNIPFEKQKEAYKGITDSTFNEIWRLSWKMMYKPTDTLQNLYLWNNGKYADFLKEVGKTDPVINQYSNSFQASGDMSPSMRAGVLMNYKYYNIKDVRVRFIIAIHYMTLNDNHYRIEKYNPELSDIRWIPFRMKQSP